MSIVRSSFTRDLAGGLDADFGFDNGFRIVQFTPPGSYCSVQFGSKVTSVSPCSMPDVYLVVSDIGPAREQLIGAGWMLAKYFTQDRPVYNSNQMVPRLALADLLPIT